MKLSWDLPLFLLLPILSFHFLNNMIVYNTRIYRREIAIVSFHIMNPKACLGFFGCAVMHMFSAMLHKMFIWNLHSLPHFATNLIIVRQVNLYLLIWWNCLCRQEVLLLDNEIAFNEAIIEEREQGINEIQQQIGEVNEIFKDLAVLVHEQGAMIGKWL